MSCYVVKPRLNREAYKVFTFLTTKPDEQAEFDWDPTAICFDFGSATFPDDAKAKQVKLAKEGDVLRIEASQKVRVSQRITHVECHDELYRAGCPTFKRIYKPGDTLFQPMLWTCWAPLDLGKLEWLYRVYIVDEVVR